MQKPKDSRATLARNATSAQGEKYVSKPGYHTTNVARPLNRIRIAHVISDSNIGGAGIYLLTYLKYHDAGKFDVFVVIPENSKLEEEIRRLGVRVITIPQLAEKTFSWLAMSKLRKIFKREKPQIVHCHAALSARVAARLCRGIKIIYTRHTYIENAKRGGFVNNLLCDKVIAVSNAAAKNVGVTSKKVKVIYNGVTQVLHDDDEKKARMRVKYNIPEGMPVVGIVARLAKLKGHNVFIDAAEILNGKAEFIIAGAGEDGEELKKYNEEKGCPARFIGFVNDVPGLMNILSVQVNATIGAEAASLSLMEGMSVGVPMVASDSGGNPELVINGENGFIVPQGDGAALADKIRKLLDDKALYAEMSRKCESIYNDRFRADRMVTEMEQTYLQLV